MISNTALFLAMEWAYSGDGSLTFVGDIVRYWIGLDRIRDESETGAWWASHVSRDLKHAHTSMEKLCVAWARSMPYPDYLRTQHWDALRTRKFDEVGKSCQLCNANECELHVHHRTYERLGHEDLSDLTVLCADCHARFHDKINKDGLALPEGRLA